MATTYVVQFEIASAIGGSLDQAAQRVREHLAQWTSRQVGRHVDAATLTASASILPTTSEVSRALVENVRWELRGTPDMQALHYELSLRPVAGDSRKLTTVITLLQQNDQFGLRVAFDEANEQLSPASPLSIYPPGFLHNVVADRTLDLRTSGQIVDGRYVNMTSPDMLPILQDAIAMDSRLPILIADIVESTEPFARKASRNLAGLAQVCVLRKGVARERPTLLEYWDIRFERDDVYLVWPGTNTPPQDFGKLNSRNWEKILTDVTKQLSGLSVRFRSSNELLAQADKAYRDEQRASFKSKVLTVRQNKDTEAETALLTARVLQLDTELREWEKFAQGVVDENTGLTASLSTQEKSILGKNKALKTQANELEELAGQLQMIQQEYADALQENARLRSALAKAYMHEEDINALQTLIPPLEPGKLQGLAEYLESSTQGAIVFTKNAIKSWANCDYPFIESMQETLTALAECAAELRSNEGFSTQGMQADDWFKERGLHISTTDGGLKQRGLHTFEFEGKLYEQLPHVKLNDYDTAAHIGRVYFAFDPENERLVVNHVGVKLYGGPERATRKSRARQRNGNGKTTPMGEPLGSPDHHDGRPSEANPTGPMRIISSGRAANGTRGAQDRKPPQDRRSGGRNQ